VHAHRPQHCKPMVRLSPDHASGEFRSLAGVGARVSIGQKVRGNPNFGRQDKSAAIGRAHGLVGLSYFAIAFDPSDGASGGNAKIFSELSAIAVARHREADPSTTSSIRRKRPSHGCGDGPPARPLIEVLRTRLAPSRTDPMTRSGRRAHVVRVARSLRVVSTSDH
jgi:hypothetical protein